MTVLTRQTGCYWYHFHALGLLYTMVLLTCQYLHYSRKRIWVIEVVKLA